MRNNQLFTLLILLIAIPHLVSAQQFGGNPPSLRWMQVNTDTARVIFPYGLDGQAKEISAIIHGLAAKTESTIGGKLRKVNIVLQNQTTIANGYASLGPFRSEFYLTPTQNSFELGSLPWYKTLAFHEYRHVQQFNNFRKGISKLSYILFGEEGQALANSIAVPDWFWEGDAVYQETDQTTQGRGKLPWFYNDYRSLWAAGKDYSWMKLRNGSYVDMVPDHYRLGYMIVLYGREKYGDNVWRDITGRSVRFKGLFYPFQHAVKKVTGEKFTDFRTSALDHFRKVADRHQTDSAATFARKNRHFAGDQEFPHWMDDTHIVYVKSNYTMIPAFYVQDIVSGKEMKIRSRDISADNYFSYNNGRIVYAAYQPDTRWGWKNYSVIRVLDIKTKKQQTVSYANKYFSPDISADGKTIIAVHHDPSGKNELHLISRKPGNVTAVIPNHNNYVYTYPRLIDTGRVVAAVRNTSGEMALGIFDISTGKAEWIVPFNTNVIGFLQVNKDTISFSMSDGGMDRLFIAVNKNVFRFIPDNENYSTGNYQLGIHNDKYVWNSFTAVGFRIMSGKGKWAPHGSAGAGKPNYDSISVNYPVTKYPKSYNLFNFHSWRPYISDPDYSYSLVGQNILNTLQSELFFTYNRNEQFKQAGASIAYGALFPVISGGASYTFDRLFPDSAVNVTWNEFNANAAISVPLVFTHGTFTQAVNFKTSFNTQQVFYTGAAKSFYDNKQFNYSDLSLSVTNQQLKARQHIYPRFAQTFSGRYRSILNKYTAQQLLLTGAVYLPGIFTNHSIVLQASYQQRDTLQQYSFSNSFPFSRGYADLNYPRMLRLGANYHFPIVYPDWGFGNIFYLLRVRGNLFYDHSIVKSLRLKKEYYFRTAGTEIYFDSKWWNQLPVSFGIRYSRLLNTDITGRSPNQWELVLPLTLLSR